jgi:tetratricopeptide (TPR) repeat protein
VEATSAVAGENAPATLTAKTLLALTLDDLQVADELKALCEDLVPRMTALFGNADRRTLNVRGCYATALRRTGDLEVAVAEGREVLSDCRRFLGNDDPRTIVGLTNLALALEESHAYEVAEALRREAVDRYKSLYPAGDRRVWEAQLDLAHLRLLMGHPDQALELQQSVLASIDMSGDAAGRVLHDALADVAASLEALGQIDGAAEAMSRHIDLHVARDGADDPTVAKMRHDLAGLLGGDG